MSIETFIEAMPKAELHVHLEGGVGRDLLLMIAEQNEIAETLKRFNSWADLLAKPDYERLDELIKVTSLWLRQAEDLTRLAYDLGTRLARQNVRYAEITVNPVLYPDLNLTLEQFLALVNDGRDRAKRAWGIDLAWIVAIPRDEPRRADDYVRFVQTAAARRSGVVGLGLIGKETSQPVGQFERAFQTAEKKDVPRAVHAGDVQGADGVNKVIEPLLPNRIADGWAVAQSDKVIKALVDGHIAVDTSPALALRTKKIAKLDEYPLRKLYDDGVTVTIGSDLPTLLKLSLTELYQAAVKNMGLGLDELQDVALNAVRASFADEDARGARLDAFKAEYEQLHAEHVAPKVVEK